MFKFFVIGAFLAFGHSTYADDTKCVQFLNNNMPSNSPIKIKIDGSLYQAGGTTAMFGGKRKMIKSNLTDVGASYEFEDTFSDPAMGKDHESVEITKPSRRVPGNWNGPRRVVVGWNGISTDYSLGSIHSCDIDQITVTKSTGSLRYIVYEENFCNAIAKLAVDDQHKDAAIAAFTKEYQNMLAIPGNKDALFGFEITKKRRIDIDSTPGEMGFVLVKDVTLQKVKDSQVQCAFRKAELVDPKTSRTDTATPGLPSSK